MEQQTQTKSPIIKYALLALLVAVLAVAGYLGTRQGGKQMFSANILAGGAFDPLSSGAKCYPESKATLKATGGGGSFDWYAMPPGNVLSASNSAPQGSILGAGPEVTFTSPLADDPNLASKYTVEAVIPGTAPGLGGGQTFIINISPPCVKSLEFVTPSGTATPDVKTGTVTISSIRAGLSNGGVIQYDASMIGSLNINYIVEPAGEARVMGNKIEVASDHSDIKVYMEIGGDKIQPVSVAKVHSRTGGDYYNLDSDKVDPTTVVVYMVDQNNQPDVYVNPSDYQFVEAPTAGDMDRIKYTGNNIPGSLFISYIIRGDTPLRSAPLTIPGTKCETLQANIFEGRGQGFYYPEPGITPSMSSTSEPFVFGSGANGTNEIKSIVISRPLEGGQIFGSATFEIKFTFDASVSGQAKLVSENDSTNSYEVAVKDEGAGNEEKTAANFIYAVNTALGGASSVIAYTSPTGNKQVILKSLEVGDHTNDYLCTQNGSAFVNQSPNASDVHPVCPLNNANPPVHVCTNYAFVGNFCFTGGKTGGDPYDPTKINKVVDPPKPLDPILYQGQAKVIYSRGGIGIVAWKSADKDIVSVSTLSGEDMPEEMLTNDNIVLSANLSGSDFEVPASGFATGGNCADKTEGDPPVAVLDSCDVTVTAPVKFKFSASGYPVTIVPATGSAIVGSIQGSDIQGTVTGTTKIFAKSGGFVEAKGTLTGSVGGDAIGGVKVDITMNVRVDAFTNPGEIPSKVTIVSTTGTLGKDTTLIPTNRSPSTGGPDVTNFAILHGKWPGKTIVTAIDNRGCAAPLDMEVKGEKLIIDYQDPLAASYFEAGQDTKLTAKTLISQTDVTNKSTWTTSDDKVATVDATGRVRAMGPGIADITAKYSTGITEIGELTSEASLPIRVNELSDITLTWDNNAIKRLTGDLKKQAFQSVVVMINRASAKGQRITIEGKPLTLTLPAPTIPYKNEIEQITAIRDKLASDAALIQNANHEALLTVTSHPKLPGALLLVLATVLVPDKNDNGMIDISTTAGPEVTILPSLPEEMTVLPQQSIGLQVIGEYDNGLTKPLNIHSAKLVADPVNRLSSTALSGGLLERGDSAGTSTLYAEYTTADGRVLTSKPAIRVTIPPGPVIEFLRMVGGLASIQQGDTIHLSAKVSDVDTVSNISDITVSLVKTKLTNYEDIRVAPPSEATWFAMSPFVDDIKIEQSNQPADQAAQPVAGDTTGGTTDDTSGDTGGTVAPSGSQALPFRVYDIPFQIPTLAGLYDGDYALVIEITDKENHEAHYVLSPFHIGKVASGDVSGDGKIDMRDVILAFRIASGKLPTATPAQMAAADIDGKGGVDMRDVILLFRKANSAT